MMMEDGELVAREARHRVANELGVAAGALRLAAEGRLPAGTMAAAVERLEAAAALNAVLCRQPGEGSVDLAEVLQALHAPLARLAAARDWSVAFAVPAVLVSDATASRLAMIVHELVLNAVRHAESTGDRFVDVEVQDGSGFIVLAVRDGGRPRAWTRSGGQGGRIVDALACAMGGVVRRGLDAERGGVEVVAPSLAPRRDPAPRSPGATARRAERRDRAGRGR